MRRTWIAVGVGLIAGAIVIGAIVLNRPSEVAAPSPSPSPSPTATATATATPTPAASPTASPSPTPQGVYMSKFGYALELPPPWHKAICGNSEAGRTLLPIVDQFTSANAIDEEIGHAGWPNDRVEVHIDDNRQGLSPVEFANARPLPGPFYDPARPGQTFPPPRSVTFAGREAAEVGPTGEPRGYFIRDGSRMFSVFYVGSTLSGATTDPATMSWIVRSFRFLSVAEFQSLQAVPDPTPIPAGAATVQALAGMLKTAFESKDVATLERLLSPCVTIGALNGGGGAQSRQRYIAGLRTQFAGGLSVTVDTNAIRTDERAPGFTFVRSRWTGPQAVTNYELLLRETRGGFYWGGALVTR